MAETKLNVKQIRFCDEYLVDLNATQAVIRAGYSKNGAAVTGVRLLMNPKIKAIIDSRMEEKNKELIASQDEVLQYLSSVLRGTSKSTEVVVEGTGDGCSEAREILKAPSEKDRLKAAELLGKRYSLFTDKVQAEGSIVTFNGESDLPE